MTTDNAKSKYIFEPCKHCGSNKQHVYGRLVIADGKASFEQLNDPDSLLKHMHAAAKKARLNVLASNIHRFEPQGISGVLVLMESHFSIHTWPEHGYIAIDIFACGKEGSPDEAVEEFARLINMKDKEVRVYDRGLL